MRFKKSQKQVLLFNKNQRELLKYNSQTMPIQEIKKLFGITTKLAIGQCAKYYFSYCSKVEA